MESSATSDPEFEELCNPRYITDDLYATMGTSLAEVFSIIITDTNGKECEVYGTIKVEDDKGSLYLYDQNSNHADYINQTDNILSLTNVDRAISAADGWFTITLDLKDGAKNGDTEFINESFRWEEGDYDKCLVKRFVGKSGSATMYYIVHTVAVEAIITACFYKGDKIATHEQQVEGVSSSEGESVSDMRDDIEQHIEDESSTDEQVNQGNDEKNDSLFFYGTIIAYYKKLFKDEESHFSRTILFWEESDTAVEVRDKYRFHLPRAVVAVPCHSSLSIEVQLCGRFPNGSGKPACWNGEVEFQARSFFGIRKGGDVKGDHGVIDLGIRWLHYYYDTVSMEHFRTVAGLKDKTYYIDD